MEFMTHVRAIEAGRREIFEAKVKGIWKDFASNSAVINADTFRQICGKMIR